MPNFQLYLEIFKSRWQSFFIFIFLPWKHFVCLKYKPTRVKYKNFRNVCSEDCVIRILCTVNILQGEPKYGHTCRACYEKYKTGHFNPSLLDNSNSNSMQRSILIIALCLTAAAMVSLDIHGWDEQNSRNWTVMVQHLSIIFADQCEF